MAKNFVIKTVDEKTCLASDVVAIRIRTRAYSNEIHGERWVYFLKVDPPGTTDNISVAIRQADLRSYREQFS